MGVIAVYSVKGGVGKTTTSFDLAWRSASRGGHRTLLWDLDLQGGSGFLLGEAQPRAPRALGAFRPGGMLRQQIRQTRYDNLHLLPADESLRILPNLLAQMGQRQRLTGLTQLLSGEFTRIVLDCPPVLNEVSDQIMAAADIIVVPLPPSPLAMRALDAIRTELTNNHMRAPPLFPVLTMYDKRRKLHREAMLSIAAEWPVIPFASTIEQVSARCMPIDLFAPNSMGAKALEDFYQLVEERLRLLPARGKGLPYNPMMAPAPPMRASGQGIMPGVLPPQGALGGGSGGGSGGRRKGSRLGESKAANFLRWLLRV